MKTIKVVAKGEQWIHKVKTKWHPPEGLFKDGSAETIADSASRGHHGDLGKAISALDFEINRGGKGLSEEIKSKVRHAIEILQKRNKK